MALQIIPYALLICCQQVTDELELGSPGDQPLEPWPLDSMVTPAVYSLELAKQPFPNFGWVKAPGAAGSLETWSHQVAL